MLYINGMIQCTLTHSHQAMVRLANLAVLAAPLITVIIALILVSVLVFQHTTSSALAVCIRRMNSSHDQREAATTTKLLALANFVAFYPCFLLLSQHLSRHS